MQNLPHRPASGCLYPAIKKSAQGNTLSGSAATLINIDHQLTRRAPYFIHSWACTSRKHLSRRVQALIDFINHELDAKA